MPNYKTPTLYVLAGVLTPGLVMYSARYMGKAPAQTRATLISDPIPQMAEFPMTPLLAEEAQDQPDPGVIESPFWFEESAFTQTMQAAEGTTEPVTRSISEPQLKIPDFIVSSILPSGKQPLVVINTKPSRIGDRVTPGWTILSIDGQHRTVTLVHDSGKQVIVPLSKDQ